MMNGLSQGLMTLIFVFLALNSAYCSATPIDTEIHFSALIEGPTCRFELKQSGGSELIILMGAAGVVGLNDIIQKTDRAQWRVDLVAQNCPTSHHVLTTVTGVSTDNSHYFFNTESSGSKGVVLALYNGENASGTPVQLNIPHNENEIGWVFTLEEGIRTGELPLMVQLELQAGTASSDISTGKFTTQVIFQFNYE